MLNKIEGLTEASQAKLAQDILSNRLFEFAVNDMKQNALDALYGVKWDDQGDALRRKRLHEIEVISNFVLYFKNIVDIHNISLSKERQKEDKKYGIV